MAGLRTASGTYDLDERREETKLYDSFTPELRAVIRESPIALDLKKLLVAFKQAESQERMKIVTGNGDPFGPAAQQALSTFEAGRDERLAAYLVRQIGYKVPGFKPIVSPQRIRPDGRRHRR